MFRVKENPDGSVSIFANDENQSFICSVDPRTSQRKVTQLNRTPRSPEKKNIVCNGRVPTSPATKYLVPKLSPHCSGKHSVTTKKRLPRKQKHENIDYDDASSVSSFSSLASTFSLASAISIESTEEPDDDCMDQWSFCRMLELINTKRWNAASGDETQELYRSFPIRKISCQSLWQDPQKLLPKRTDEVDISSVLGQNILCVHPRIPNFDSQESPISKYEKFCKSNVLNLQPFVWQLPILRNREIRSKFSVTYNKLKLDYTHHYTFSKKQKRDRFKQLRLGLNHRSFVLKQKCKKLSVRVERLSQDTLNRHCKQTGTNCYDVLRPSCKPQTDENIAVQHVRLPNGVCREIPVIDLEPPDGVALILKRVVLKMVNSFHNL